MLPATPARGGAEHHVAAAARGARGVRARISDRADQPLRRQHLAHRGLRRHGALGAAPQAEVARRRMQRLDVAHRLCERPLRAACATPASISRTAATSSPTASTRSARSVGGQAGRRDAASRPAGALARASSRIRMPMARAALTIVLREVVRRNRVRDGLVYLQVTPRRRAARPRLSAPDVAAGARGDSASSLDRARRDRGPRGGRRASSRCPTTAGSACDIKTVGAAAECARQAEGEARPAPRGLVRRPRRLRHRRRLHQRLDRDRRRTLVTRPTEPTSCPASPASSRRARPPRGACRRGAALHRRRGAGGARGLHDRREHGCHAGREDRRRAGRIRHGPGSSRRGCGRSFTARPKSRRPGSPTKKPKSPAFRAGRKFSVTRPGRSRQTGVGPRPKNSAKPKKKKNMKMAEQQYVAGPANRQQLIVGKAASRR